MTGDTIARLTALAMSLTLVTSALAVRRVPMTTTLRLVVIWIAIFALVIGGAVLVTRMRQAPPSDDVEQQTINNLT